MYNNTCKEHTYKLPGQDGERRKMNEEMTMTEIARLIEGLRSAGWEEKKINDFLLYIESGSEEFKPKEEK